MTEKEYEAIDAVRRSDLWQINKSPMHYLYAVTHEEEPTTALLFGSAAHKYILEQEDFWNEYVLAPEIDRRTKQGRADYNAFLDSIGDKSIIKIADYTVIQDMDAAICANPTAKALLKTGKHEVPIVWTDPDTGTKCKCKPDCMTIFDGVPLVVDYKTTKSCEDGAFERSCRSYGYKLQAGMYREGVFQSTFESYGFAFVAQEKEAPYAVRVYFCTDEFCNEGLDQFRTLIGIYADCKKKGIWNGYEDADLMPEG